MPNTTPENDSNCNSLVILPESAPSAAEDIRRQQAGEEAERQQANAIEYQHSLLCTLTLPPCVRIDVASRKENV